MFRETHHWSLWRGDAKTLRHYTRVVGGARAVPQQLPVVQFFEWTVTLVLPFSAYFEHLKVEKNQKTVRAATKTHRPRNNAAMLLTSCTSSV